MAELTRRDLLRMGGLAVAGAAAAPWLRADAAFANGPALGSGPTQLQSIRRATTMARTIVRGARLGEGTAGTYFRLTYGPGEKHLRRTELGRRRSPGAGRPLVTFIHACDNQLADAQSPARVEFLDRVDGDLCNATPFEASFRPQESLNANEIEQMNRTLKRIRRGPVAGGRVAFTMFTGDNADNAQRNELRWFIDLMDGGKRITPNSGGPEWEGVQSVNWLLPTGTPDPSYWHPDPAADTYKQRFGFPDYPGLLEEAIKPFRATGVGTPWYQVLGNHDSLMQGNVAENPAFEAIALGSLKATGGPPGLTPCDGFETLLSNPAALFTGPAVPVTADPGRQVVTRRQYIEEFFTTSGAPRGHGFTQANRETGQGYYVIDRPGTPPIRMICLDTVNPGGFNSGSVGRAQFDWLEQQLIAAHSTYYDAAGEQVHTDHRDRIVLMFGHHALRTLDNPVIAPNPFDPADNDLPRVMADEIEALVHRFPNLVAWFSGHTHDNFIEAQPDPAGRTNGFWDVTTASQCDWVIQTRVVEVCHNAVDRTLSIWCTMVDHDAPADPRGARGIARLASIHRELAANDPHLGFATGYGERKDRNVELVIRAPAWLPQA